MTKAHAAPLGRWALINDWLLVIGGGVLLLSSGCISASNQHGQPTSKAAAESRYEFSRALMGLPFRIVLYAPDQTTASNAVAAAFARIKELNDALSDYDPESELSRLSQTAGSGQAVRVSPDLWHVLERAQLLAKQSGGAFDVTVGPVVELWRRARREKKFPSADRLAAARAAIVWKTLQLNKRDHTARLLVPKMRLDLGAIAKGYATDEAIAVLRAHGLPRALVTGGGDMRAGEPPPGKRAWRIELAPLDGSNAPPARFVSLVRAGLATSGDVFQHIEIDGRRYSHIVDPRTGVGLTDQSLVTVLARDGLTADSLATAVSVLGPERGLRLVESTRGAAARIVRRPAADRIEVRESPGFKQFYER